MSAYNQEKTSTKLIKNILTEINGGKREFAPENNSVEELKNFNLKAQYIVEAKNLGYIEDVKVQLSKSRNTHYDVKRCLVIGGLKTKGLEFLFEQDSNSYHPDAY